MWESITKERVSAKQTAAPAAPRTPWHAVSVEGGATAAAQGLPDGVGLSLCVPAPRRSACSIATRAGSVESCAYPLPRRGAASATG